MYTVEIKNKEQKWTKRENKYKYKHWMNTIGFYLNKILFTCYNIILYTAIHTQKKSKKLYTITIKK